MRHRVSLVIGFLAFAMLVAIGVLVPTAHPSTAAPALEAQASLDDALGCDDASMAEPTACRNCVTLDVCTALGQGCTCARGPGVCKACGGGFICVLVKKGGN
jgi:hypothetical protein